MSYRDREPNSMRVAMLEPALSPPNAFLGPTMMQPEMPPMRTNQRWYGTEVYNSEYQPSLSHPYGQRMQTDERYSPVSGRRCLPTPVTSDSVKQVPSSSSEASRYAKWRERRDTIINLDRETAQLSSRTDSFKSSLQQADSDRALKTSDIRLPASKTAREKSSEIVVKNEQVDEKEKNHDGEVQDKDKSDDKNGKSEKTSKSVSENQEISDGEIVDDEDSDSDDSETMSTSAMLSVRPLDRLTGLEQAPTLSPAGSGSYPRRVRDSQFERDFYSEAQPLTKKRRLQERDDYLLDYETISDDEDLEDIMAEKIGDDSSRYMSEGGAGILGVEDGTSTGTIAKKSSEIELLNALGLDWANLVEIAKQSRNTNSTSSGEPGSALARFSVPNYLPTLGISLELAGPKLFDLVSRVCRV